MKFYLLRWVCSLADLCSGLVGTFTFGFVQLVGLQLRALRLFVDRCELDEFIGETRT